MQSGQNLENARLNATLREGFRAKNIGYIP